MRKPRVLLDPNTLSTDGTVALAGESVSDDGKLMAYGMAHVGIGLARSGTCAMWTRAKTLPDLI